MSEWIKWEGGVCPVDTEAMIMTKLRNGWESHAPAMAGYHRWDHGRTPTSPLRANDIIAYRLVMAKGPTWTSWEDSVLEAARKAAIDACAYFGHKGLAAFGNGCFDLAYKAAYEAIQAWRK